MFLLSFSFSPQSYQLTPVAGKHTKSYQLTPVHATKSYQLTPVANAKVFQLTPVHGAHPTQSAAPAKLDLSAAVDLTPVMVAPRASFASTALVCGAAPIAASTAAAAAARAKQVRAQVDALLTSAELAQALPDAATRRNLLSTLGELAAKTRMQIKAGTCEADECARLKQLDAVLTRAESLQVRFFVVFLTLFSSALCVTL